MTSISGYVRYNKLEEYVTLIRFNELVQKVEIMVKEIAVLTKENNQMKESIYENQDKIVINNKRYDTMSKRVLELDEMKEDIRKVSKENNTSKSIKKNEKTVNDEIDELKKEKG